MVLVFPYILDLTPPARFEWDSKKEAAKITKAGVNFTEGASAFLDPQRVLAADEKHSAAEPRFFCIGQTERGILTVRFTLRGRNIRLIGAGYWRKGRKLYEDQNR